MLNIYVLTCKNYKSSPPALLRFPSSDSYDLSKSETIDLNMKIALRLIHSQKFVSPSRTSKLR
ncbi:hypothetical protein ACTXT7_006834 [Hymenolepis weldensis]